MLNHIIEFFRQKIPRKKNKNLAIGHYVPNKIEFKTNKTVPADSYSLELQKVVRMVSVIERLPENDIQVSFYQHDDQYIISDIRCGKRRLRGFDFSQIKESVSNIYDNGEFVFDMNSNYLSVFRSIYQVNPYGEGPFILRIEFNNEIFYVEKEDDLSRIKSIK